MDLSTSYSQIKMYGYLDEEVLSMVGYEYGISWKGIV